MVSAGLDIRFNSMKVRLKPKVLPFPKFVLLFQFHEGPIKANRPCYIVLLVFTFQFHEGPIKAWRGL